jgi:hypothetical protein
LRGLVLRVVASRGEGNEMPPPLADGDDPITTIPLAPDSDDWSAYAIVAGTAPDVLAGTEFLVDSNGWLRMIFEPASPNIWLDPSVFIAAAREAEAHPIELEGGAQMHHHH